MNVLAISPVPNPANNDDYVRDETAAKGFQGCVRACEAEASAKTASDYQHIVWAYGVIWSIFAVYGILLWRRAVSQQADMAELARKVQELE